MVGGDIRGHVGGNVSFMGSIGKSCGVGLGSMGLLNSEILSPVFGPRGSVFRCVYLVGHVLRGILLSGEVLGPVSGPCRRVTGNVICSIMSNILLVHSSNFCLFLLKHLVLVLNFEVSDFGNEVMVLLWVRCLLLVGISWLNPNLLSRGVVSYGKF